MKFQVYGFDCSRTQKLQASCEELVRQMNNQSTCEVIKNAEAMKAIGILNTPALVIDGKLLFQGCAMSASGIAEMLKKLAL